MTSKRFARYLAASVGAAAIAASGLLTACGGNEKTAPSTTTTTTTTTAPSVSPTQNAPQLPPGASFSPSNPAPPPVYTTHREREYPY